MSRFNYVGYPTTDQISDLLEYLGIKYSMIPEQKRALQHEIDNLNITLNSLLKAEAVNAKGTKKKSGHYASATYVKNPLLGEDRTYFDTHRFSSVETGAVVDALIRPWTEHIKKDQEALDYKIRKVKYLIEQRSLQIQLLEQIESELKDTK